jgi:hypothetical protein
VTFDAGPPIVSPRPDVPDGGTRIDAGDPADVGGPGPGPDGGDGGAPDPAVVVGTIRAWQYESGLGRFETGARGRIADVRAVADPSDPFQRTATEVFSGNNTVCELIQTAAPEAGTGVQVEQVEGTQVGGMMPTSFVLDSLASGALVERTGATVPSMLFAGAPGTVGAPGTGTSRIDFDLAPGTGSGRLEPVATVEVDAPVRYGPVMPPTDATLNIQAQNQFMFDQPTASLATLELVVRIFDRADRLDQRPQVEVECRASPLTAALFILPPEAGQAFYGAQPAPQGGVALEIGFRSRETVTAAVQGGGAASLTFELFRGSRYRDIADP